MKTVLQIILGLLFFSTAFGQLEVNKPIVLTGSGIDAKVVGIQNVSNMQDAVSVDYIQKDSLKFAIATGSNNNYSVNLTPAVSSLSVGMVVLFQANFSNTGAATLSVNGLSSKTIKKNYNTDLDTNDIRAGQMVSVMYDGNNFQMLSQIANVPQIPQQQQIPPTVGIVLLYADESTSIASSYNAAIKSYSLQSNTYSKIIVEAEGNMAISVNGGSTCSTTAAINVAGSDIKSASFSRGVTGYDSWAVPFSIKATTVQQGATNVNVGGSFSMSGAGSGTIYVTSLRVYGVY